MAIFRYIGFKKGNKCFFPSATKFHYQWNMREISRVIDGVLRTASANYKDVVQIYKLWYHECNRVFKDRLLFADDIKTVIKNTYDTAKSWAKAYADSKK